MRVSVEYYSLFSRYIQLRGKGVKLLSSARPVRAPVPLSCPGVQERSRISTFELSRSSLASIFTNTILVPGR